MRKYFIISPREPSGATWLINCLLELNIKTFRNSSKGMWKSVDEVYTLNQNENILKKWLPALSRKQSFLFRNDIEIEWSHEWPTKKFEESQIIYFIRDPRDSIYSRYKRENPNQSYRQFIEFPDPLTLMNKIDNWCVYNYYWMSFDKISVFRFEDYKDNALSTLKSIIKYIDLNISDDLIKTAVDESTFEKASEAEAKYLLNNPQDTEKINRSGKHGEWKLNDESKDIAKIIEGRCSDLLYKFGYSVNKSQNNIFYLPKLSVFDRLITAPMLSNDIKYELNISGRIVDFSKKVNSELITNSELKTYEIVKLIESLIEYLNYHKVKKWEKLSEMYIKFSGLDNYHYFIFTITGKRISLLKSVIISLLKKIFRRVHFLISKFHAVAS